MTKAVLASAEMDTRLLLRVVLQGEPDIVVAGDAASGGELTVLVLESSPDVVLLDLDAPGPATLAAVMELAALPGMPTRFVGLAGRGTAVDERLLGGLDSLLRKDDPLAQLSATVRRIVREGRRLQPIGAVQPQAVTSRGEGQIETPAVIAPPVKQSAAVGSAAAQEAEQPSTQPLPAAGTEPASPASSEAPTSPPATVSTEAAETLAVAAEPGQGWKTISLTVSAFGSFRALAAFQQALEGLDGVGAVKIRRFYRGTLYAMVHYDGPVPFVERLMELQRFNPKVIASSPGSVELRVDFGDGQALQASTVS